MVEPLGKEAVPSRIFLFGKRIGEVREQTLDIAGTEEPGNLPHENSGSAEGLNHEAEAFKLGSGIREKRSSLAVKLNDFGDEEKLPRDSAIGKAPLQPLID